MKKQYIDKSTIIVEIEKKLQDLIASKKDASCSEERVISRAKIDMCKEILSLINTIETKEVDLDALGVLAEHLIACDAHLVTPKYTDKELDLLEEWTKNNKTQKEK